MDCLARASSSVLISVCSIAADADVIEFNAEPNTTVLALKFHIADNFRIAPGSQNLVRNGCVISDSECVGNYVGSCSDTLSLTLVLSTEEIETAYDELRTNSLDALETLGTWFSHGTGDERAILAVTAQLDRTGPPRKKPGPSRVQLMAVKTLKEIVTKGDDLAVAEVIKRLDNRGLVQEAAFLALPEVVDEGDERALSALYQRLKDPNERVRTRAFAAMVGVAGKGNPYAIAEVIGLLSHCDPGVRASAAICLGEIANKGDVTSIAALNELKGDRVGCVLRAAAESLEILAAG
eukprot:TRINITY_DN15313_c0_g1_i3.p1 TRINITY_DN15313_c0_g1~~TRINITY_DN15313_c0_g1_i3.p1  ORF type:complete len:294 (-),score=40.57 TRINITY_DN15313_c0_g1_i3:129-1010(-)